MMAFRLVKAMDFPVVMYGWESWTMKKAERWRIDVFELWCWRRLFRVPWTARRSNQSILKEISPGCSLEGLMLKLKLQYSTSCEELAHWKRPWCWEGLGAGGEGDDRGWDGWMASPTRWTWVWVNSRSWWWTGRPGVLWFMGSQRVGHNWATELWTVNYWRDHLPEMNCISWTEIMAVGELLHYTESPPNSSVTAVEWCGTRRSRFDECLAHLPSAVSLAVPAPEISHTPCSSPPPRAFSCKRPAGNSGARGH